MSLSDFLHGAEDAQDGWLASIVDVRTASTISRTRLKLDALRVARSLHDGGLLSKNAANKTVLLHLPNCVAFLPLLLGSLTVGAHVVLASPDSTAPKLAKILDETRPRVIFTRFGAGGEDLVGEAVKMLLSSHNAWARELTNAHRLAAKTRLHPSELAPFKCRRIWTVNPDADYYGTSFLLRAPTAPVAASRADSQDWTVLLLPPPGHKHAGNQDPDQVGLMALSGDDARLPFKSQLSISPEASALTTYEANGQAQTWSHRSAIEVIRTIINDRALKTSGGAAVPWLGTLAWTSAEGLFGQVLAALAGRASLLSLPRPLYTKTENDQLHRVLGSQHSAVAHLPTVQAAEDLAQKAAELSLLRVLVVAEDTSRTKAGSLPLLSIGRILSGAQTNRPTNKSRL